MDPVHPKTDRLDPNREILDGSEDIRVKFRVLFSDSGHINTLVWTRFFLLKKTLPSPPPLALCLPWLPPSALHLCVSRIYCFVYKL